MKNSYHELPGKKVGLCVSGGLDSRTLARKLRDLDIDVVCFTADLGQPDETDIEDIRTRMAPCDVDTEIVDLKADMADACHEVLKCQAMYDGGYWNSTGIARAVAVRGLLPQMRAHGCSVLAHGATGRGNDQVRFHRYTNVLAPDFYVYAPWRDQDLLTEFPGRRQMIEYLARLGIETAAETKKRYSTDANLAGLSHEAEDLESLETPCTIVEPTMGVWAQDAPDSVESVTVTFESGYAVAINDRPLDRLTILRTANEIGGRNGVGIKNALENRVIGTKSRGVYESPGMELLGSCLAMVYQAVLDRRSAQLFQHVSRIVADQIYDGRYFEPVTTAARQAIEALARFATGTVSVGLYKGNIQFQSMVNIPSSLYHMEDSSMEASDGLNPVSSQGFMEIGSVEALSLAGAGQIEQGIRL